MSEEAQTMAGLRIAELTFGAPPLPLRFLSRHFFCLGTNSWHCGLRIRYRFALTILLALVTFFLFFVYIMATHHELHLLNYQIGDNAIPLMKPSIYVVSFGLAILFSALFASCRNLLVYAAIMVVYNLFDLWGNFEVLKKIGPPLEKKLALAKTQAEREPLQTLRSFYFERPTLQRIVTIMFMNWVVVCLGLVFLLTRDASFRNAGYVLLMLNIIGGEVVVHTWRARSIYNSCGASLTIRSSRRARFASTRLSLGVRPHKILAVPKGKGCCTFSTECGLRRDSSSCRGRSYCSRRRVGCRRKIFALYSVGGLASEAAFGLYSVLHLLWLMPLAVVVGSLGPLGMSIIGVAMAVLIFAFHHR